ncbi:hypothetical protein C8J56DRAFT_883675 [Mycena floridula]|nr:hypothetical protein C8J56DRAFT_883675 [Mycena floridula]
MENNMVVYDSGSSTLILTHSNHHLMEQEEKHCEKAGSIRAPTDIAWILSACSPEHCNWTEPAATHQLCSNMKEHTELVIYPSILHQTEIFYLIVLIHLPPSGVEQSIGFDGLGTLKTPAYPKFDLNFDSDPSVSLTPSITEGNDSMLGASGVRRSSERTLESAMRAYKALLKQAHATFLILINAPIPSTLVFFDAF